MPLLMCKTKLLRAKTMQSKHVFIVGWQAILICGTLWANLWYGLAQNENVPGVLRQL